MKKETKEKRKLTPSDFFGEVYSDLSAPLPEVAIQTTSGKETKKGYDTTGYGYQFAINRLNQIFGLNWGLYYEVLRVGEGQTSTGRTTYSITIQMTIWVMDRKNARTCIGGHTAMDYSDAMKGAFTNSFKKTAALFGIGRQAYEGTIDEDNKKSNLKDNEEMTEKYKSVWDYAKANKVSEKDIKTIQKGIEKGKQPESILDWLKSKYNTKDIEPELSFPEEDEQAKFDNLLATYRLSDIEKDAARTEWSKTDNHSKMLKNLDKILSERVKIEKQLNKGTNNRIPAFVLSYIETLDEKKRVKIYKKFATEKLLPIKIWEFKVSEMMSFATMKDEEGQ